MKHIKEYNRRTGHCTKLLHIFMIVFKEGVKWEDEKSILLFNFYLFTDFML